MLSLFLYIIAVIIINSYIEQNMPFTLSHPSLFLPMLYVQRKWFSVTALAIGSMAPDFEYFIRMRIKSDYSHTLLGVFWFDLPLTILIAFVFHNLIRDSFYNNLPYALQARLKPFNRFDWKSYFIKNWFVVVTCALIGIFSHLLWDSFTHETGFFVGKVSFLSRDILTVPVYKILQHSSTLLGAFVICFVIWKLPCNDSVEKTEVNPYYWIFFLSTVLLIIVLRLLFGLSYRQYGHVIVTAISASFIALMITPILMRVFCRRSS